jgi:hypothetical protein
MRCGIIENVENCDWSGRFGLIGCVCGRFSQRFPICVLWASVLIGQSAFSSLSPNHPHLYPSLHCSLFWLIPLGLFVDMFNQSRFDAHHPIRCQSSPFSIVLILGLLMRTAHSHCPYLIFLAHIDELSPPHISSSIYELIGPLHDAPGCKPCVFAALSSAPIHQIPKRRERPH